MIIKTPISDLLIYRPQVFSDSRGFFCESYNDSTFQKLGLNYHWVQDNFSSSKKGVLRGLHFQRPPYEQAKMVCVMRGAAFDVAVDLRNDSKTYGQWFGLELNDQMPQYLIIPRGFAHGFLSLKEDTLFCYKVDNYYNSSADSGILYNDIDLNISWPGNHSEFQISPKDLNLNSLKTHKMSHNS